MAMGRREDRARTSAFGSRRTSCHDGRPLFYQHLNQVLNDAHGIDDFVEAQCAPFYATKLGRGNVQAVILHSSGYALRPDTWA